MKLFFFLLGLALYYYAGCHFYEFNKDFALGIFLFLLGKFAVDVAGSIE